MVWTTRQDGLSGIELLFTNYCTAAKITDETLKLATFLNLAGDQIDEIVQALADDKIKIEVEHKILSDHFEASKNTDKLILTFRQAKQRVGEGVESYVNRLHTMGADCDLRV